MSHTLLKVPRLLHFRKLAFILTFFPSHPYLESNTCSEKPKHYTGFSHPGPLEPPLCCHYHPPTPTKEQGKAGRALGGGLPGIIICNTKGKHTSMGFR